MDLQSVFGRARVPVFASLFLPLALLSACDTTSSSSTDDDDERPEAFMVVGQADFAELYSNRGGSTDALGLGQPQGGIATDGNLFYVADFSNNRVLGWNRIPDTLSQAPDFVLGQADFSSSAAGTSGAALALPTHVTIGDGKLAVTDAGNNRVLLWNSLPSGNTPPDVVVGQDDFTSAEPGSGASRMSYPVWAEIAAGRLLVSDQRNHRVLVWNTLPDSNGAPADVVVGQPDFDTVEADDEEAGLTNPAGLWSDGFRLLVADSGNNRVLYWQQLPRSAGEEATYVIGQSDFSRSSAGVSQSQLRTPFGITSDGTRFYVADAGNNRVLEFDSFPIANQPLAIDVYGQDDFSSLLKNDIDLDGDSDDEASEQTLNSPTGLSLRDGVLYVTDRNNHRVLFFPG